MLPKKLYAFILSATKTRQMLLGGLTLLMFPALYLMLEIPKLIINETLMKHETGIFLWGRSFTPIGLLICLSVAFLAILIANSVLKYYINTIQNRMTEDTTLFLRKNLYERFLWSLCIKKPQASELIQPLIPEVEAVGLFSGDAFVLPLREAGTLLTLASFMFVQNPKLAAAAVILYPLQAYLIPRIQKKINALIQERITQTRTLSTLVEETVVGHDDIRAYKLEKLYSKKVNLFLNSIYALKVRIGDLKYFAKSLGNLMNNFIPFLFYSVGGYFVIMDELTVGALVAIVAAHKELHQPWRSLLNFYQRFHDAHGRYENILERFTPYRKNPRKPENVEENSLKNYHFKKAVLKNETDHTALNLNFKLPLKTHTAFVGNEFVRNKFGSLLSGMLSPHEGEIFIESKDKKILPQNLLGQKIGVFCKKPFLFKGPLLQNLTLLEKIKDQKRLDKLIEVVDFDDDLLFLGLKCGKPSEKLQKQLLEVRAWIHQNTRRREGILIEPFKNEGYHYYKPLHANISHCFIDPHAFEGLKKDYFHYIEDLIVKLGFQKIFQTFETQIKDIDDSVRPLHYIAASYQVQLIDQKLEEAITALRTAFKEHLPKNLADKCHFYEEGHYDTALSVEENLIFGTPQPFLFEVQRTIYDLMIKALKKFDLMDPLKELGLLSELGPYGFPFDAKQKQKVSLFRALYQNPDILILDGGFQDFSASELEHLTKNLRTFMKGKTIFFIPMRLRNAQVFNEICVLDNEGQITQKGKYPELLAEKGFFYNLIKTEK